MKKWLIATALSLGAIPLIVFGRDKLIQAFANTQEVPTIKQAVVELHESNAELKGIAERQEHRADLQDEEIKKNKEVTTAQLDVLKELVLRLKQ